MSLNKTGIEWCDYTINPVKGLCPMACSYCYARKMYKRFKWDESIYYDNDVWNGLIKLDGKPRQRIFVGSTIELFGDWVKEEWLDQIFRWVRGTPEHTFIFLTKQPQNLIKFSPFPDNAWVGGTVTDNDSFLTTMPYLARVEAAVKYLSIEPFLDYIYVKNISIECLNWVIIGACTGNITDLQKLASEHEGTHLVRQAPKWTLQPKIEWVKEIVEAADKAGVKVFLKNNLEPLIRKEVPLFQIDSSGFIKDGDLKQEVPK